MLFDRVIILSEGYTLYNGPPGEARNHFKQFGFEMPTYTNPADRLIQLANAPHGLISKPYTFLDMVK